MPSIILAPIKFTSAEGNITFGDVLQVAPKSTSKAYSGAGGGNIGDFMRTNSLLSYTITNDPDVLDSLTSFNN